MTPEEKRMLERALKLAEENNVLVHKIYNSLRWNRVFKFIYWIIIIGIGVGTIYYLEPYLNQVLDLYGGIKENVTSIENLISPLNDN